MKKSMQIFPSEATWMQRHVAACPALGHKIKNHGRSPYLQSLPEKGSGKMAFERRR